MNRSPLAPTLAVLIVACTTFGCAAPVLATRARLAQPPQPAPVAELWREPTNVRERDLLWGSGVPAERPSANVMYKVLEKDETGYSPGYDVVGPDGRKWSIKVGKEVQTEIVLSRLLWALGYYQPVMYYVTDWQLEGTWKYEGQPARFRLQSDHHSDGEWAWTKNPFVASQPFRGLIAINLLLNNWDFKTSNNRVYRVDGAGEEIPRRFVVQDLGASLGKPRPIRIGTRNDIEDFESTRLIKEVDGTHVALDYHGRHRDVIGLVTVDDMVWACELMARLDDQQLDDAFRGAGFAPDLRARYITKIRAKINEGLALRSVAIARAGETK